MKEDTLGVPDGLVDGLMNPLPGPAQKLPFVRHGGMPGRAVKKSSHGAPLMARRLPQLDSCIEARMMKGPSL